MKKGVLQKARARRWTIVGGVSLVLHGLLGWALLAGVPPSPVLVDPPAVEVELLAPEAPTHRAEATRPALPPLAPAPHVPTSRPPPAVAPSPIPAPPARVTADTIVAPPGFKARGAPSGGGEALTEAVRRGGCGHADLLKLTESERQACEDRLTAAIKKAPLYAAIDPEKKAAFDGDCKKDDDWCLYRSGKGPYPGLFALGKKKKRPGWDD